MLLTKEVNPSPGNDFYNMPGGRVKASESARDAIVRELGEELGRSFECPEPIKIMENFFFYDNKSYHEILFIFQSNFTDFYKLSQQKQFVALDNSEMGFTWFDVKEIKNLVCKPEIIYKLAKRKNHKFNYEIGR